MNPQQSQDPLAQLQDIHLPSAIGLWPPAWGWWLLLLVIIALAAATFFFVGRYKLRNGYRQLAVEELQNIQLRYSSGQTSEYLQAISILLRRTALSGFGSEFDTSIKGEDWLRWLDQQMVKPDFSFESEAGRVLLLGPYQKHPAIDRAQLHAMVLAWILQHRNQWQQKAKKIIRPEVVQQEARQDV